MKICTGCKQEKPLVEFSNKKTAKDGKHSRCKVCTRQYTRQHYKDNKKYYADKRRKRQLELREWYIDYKSKLKCIECGEDRYWCLEFHHKEMSEKDSNPSETLFAYGKKAFLEEIEKCDVLCANCHRDVHHKMRL